MAEEQSREEILAQSAYLARILLQMVKEAGGTRLIDLSEPIAGTIQIEPSGENPRLLRLTIFESVN